MELNYVEVLTTFITGLGIFFFGLKIMGDSLKASAGDKLRHYIDKFTTNPVSGVLTGIVVTGLIQSSSGTSAVAIGLAAAGMMTLPQTIAVLIGSNIGTTVTAFLIGLKLSTYAPLIVGLGSIWYYFTKGRKEQIGAAVVGFGALFIGMSVMGEAMAFLKTAPEAVELFAKIAETPILGTVIGAGFTALIQSSSATLGIVQSMAAEGLIPLGAAIPFVLGANIGTTITGVIAGIGGGLVARRAAFANIVFNITGTVLFLLILTPFTNLIINIDSALGLNIEMTIALAHFIFNVTMTLIFLVLLKYFIAWTEKVIKPREGEEEIEMNPQLNDEVAELSPEIAMMAVINDVSQGQGIVTKSIRDTRKFIADANQRALNNIYKYEDIVDAMDTNVNKHLINISKNIDKDEDAVKLSILVKVSKELERTADILSKIGKEYEVLRENKENFSSESKEELLGLFDKIEEINEIATKSLDTPTSELYDQAITLESKISVYSEHLTEKYVHKLKKGQEKAISGVKWGEIITDLNRVARHQRNVTKLAYRYTTFNKDEE